MKSRILYFGMSGNLGGIESFIINFWRELRKNNIDIDFIKVSDKICFEEEFISGGSKVYRLADRQSNPLRYLKSIYGFLKEHKEYKIIHIHLNTCSSIEPIIAAKLLGRKVIVHSHSDWKGTSKITKILHSINKPISYYLSNERLACSKEAGWWLYGKRDFRIIKNAINGKKYIFNEENRSKIRNEMGIRDKFIIGHIGRFSYPKNHEFLIKVFYEVHKKNPDSVLLLVGDGELRPKIEKQIRDLNLSDHVILTGVREDVQDLLFAMDVFVFPSIFEGLGIVAIEAQATGLPCIVADSVPQEVRITSLVNYLPLHTSPENWANSILDYKNFDRQDSYDQLRASGYDIETAAKELANIYINYY